VLLTTAWPGELKDPAKKLAGLLGDFASAIDTDKPDMAKVTDASNKVHAGEHDFSHQVWDYLGKKAGLAMGADEDHAEASSASPTAAAAKLQVTGVTARPTTNDVSAIYFTVKNSGAADRLVSAAVDASVATMVQLHTMVTTGGTTQMQQVTGIDVPANGEVTLKPGGYHVMLMNVQKPLKEGDSIAVTLTFEKAGAVKVTASVHEISGGMGN
jgi:copper(I)-binding protein